MKMLSVLFSLRGSELRARGMLFEDQELERLEEDRTLTRARRATASSRSGNGPGLARCRFMRVSERSIF